MQGSWSRAQAPVTTATATYPTNTLSTRLTEEADSGETGESQIALCEANQCLQRFQNSTIPQRLRVNQGLVASLCVLFAVVRLWRQMDPLRLFSARKKALQEAPPRGTLPLIIEGKIKKKGCCKSPVHVVWHWLTPSLRRSEP